MLRFLLILSVLLSACSEPETVVGTPSKSAKAIDLSRLSLEDIEIQLFDNPYLENDLVFRNLRLNSAKSKRFKVRNTNSRKGFLTWDKQEWKRHGKWFLFQNGILQQRVSYKSGVKDGRETVYDSLGVMVSSGRFVNDKRRYTFNLYDENLNKSISCYDHLGDDLTCCPFFRCGQAARRYRRKVHGP